jgi:hypothetical protein
VRDDEVIEHPVDAPPADVFPVIGDRTVIRSIKAPCAVRLKTLASPKRVADEPMPESVAVRISFPPWSLFCICRASP